MWPPRRTPNFAVLTPNVAQALDRFAVDRAAELVVEAAGPNRHDQLVRLRQLVELETFYGRSSDAVRLNSWIGNAGMQPPSTTLLESARIWLATGWAHLAFDIYEKLLLNPPSDADTVLLFLDVAEHLWTYQQFRPAVDWASRAVRVARTEPAGPDRDGGLRVALDDRDRYLTRLGVTPPDTALAEFADADLVARESPAAERQETDPVAAALAAEDVSARSHHSLMRLASEHPYGILCGFFPAEEWPKGAMLWPDIAEDGTTWHDHLGAVALGAEAAWYACPALPVAIVPLSVADLLDFAANNSMPWDQQWTRDFAAIDAIRRGVEPHIWPSPDDAPCWCGSGLALAGCCDGRLSHRARVAADGLRRQSRLSLVR